MRMIMAEFAGKRAGYFRPKPVYKTGTGCPRCGSRNHIGRTTCVIRTLDGAVMVPVSKM